MLAFLADPHWSEGRNGGRWTGFLFPVGEDNFPGGKSSQSGKRVISLEVAHDCGTFEAWKLLVFTQG
jgi:hypothetical protein